jgi:uncharacterized protein YjbI with pentapeptide repeats
MVRRRLIGLAACGLLASVGLATANAGIAQAATVGMGFTPSIGGPIGTVLNATVLFGAHPQANVEFELYGPDDPSCAHAPIYDQVAPLISGARDISATTYPGFKTSEMGTYQWTLSVVDSPTDEGFGCGVIEVVIAPTLPTTPSSGGPVGTTLYDTATPTGGDATGTIDFALNIRDYDGRCDALVYTETEPLVNGTATTDGYTPPAPGIYEWIASYGGDTNHEAALSQCGDESVVIDDPSDGLTPTGESGVTVSPVLTSTAGGANIIGPVTVTFDSVSAQGVTQMTLTTEVTSPPAGYQLGTSPVYYDITTTAPHSGPITVCLAYPDLFNSSPNQLQLLHYSGGQWQNITTSLDTTDQIICGETTSLSPFVIAEPAQASQSTAFGPLANQVYGAGPLMLTATASSGLPVAYATTGPCSVSGTTLTITGAGSCTVIASQAGNSSWLAASPVSQSFTTTPTPLTISAVSSSRTYGVANPAFTPTYSGFVNGDTAASLTTAPTCTTTATTFSPVGTYPITCSGTVDPDYSFTYVAGTLKIAIADRFVTPTNTTLSVAGPGFLALTNVTGATVVVSTQPGGKLTLGSGGAFTYVPKTGFSGTDSFAYRLSTNGSLSAPVTVTMYVVGTGMNCSKCNLSGLTVSGVNLTGANLSSANLTGARLTSVNLTGTNLSSAILSYAALDHANLTGANLSSVTLSYAALDHATMTGANLSSAVLSNASLTYANLTGANLAKATLTGANLTGATLTGANLTGANMSGATLTSATLTGVAWSNTVCPDSTNSSKDGGTCVGHLGP